MLAQFRVDSRRSAIALRIGATADTEFPGDLPELDVKFNGGIGGRVFRIVPPIVTMAKHRYAWQWYYRVPPNGPRIDFDRSSHELFTLLAPPRDPWFPQLNDVSRLPRVEVLDLVCRWASGAGSLREAADRIARELYGCSRLRYNGSSSEFLNGDRFMLDCLLAHLSGSIAIKDIDCRACATTVSTLANLIGCRLEIAHFESNFSTNQIQLIGENSLQAKHFEMHEAAVDTSLIGDDSVWDACLALPVKGTVVVPTGQPLGQIRTPNSYRVALLDPRDEPRVVVSPEGVRDFAEGSRFFRLQLPVDPSRFGFNRWFLTKQANGFAVWGLTSLRTPLPPDWQRTGGEDLKSEGGQSLSLSHWRSQLGDDLTIRIYEFGSREESHLALFETLANTAEVNRYSISAAAGEVAFAAEEPRFPFLFVRGNLLVDLRTASGSSSLLRNVARTLDERLTFRLEVSATRFSPARFGAMIPLKPQLDQFWYRLWSDSGEIVIVSESAFVNEVEPGETAVRVVAYPEGSPGAEPIHYEIEL